ncbi:MAG: methyl-accepting chemotaxis protein [Paracoccaceae bacterium]
MTAAVSNFFGSIMVRLALIFGALATMTAAAIVVGWMVFQSIATNMAVLSQEHLPNLRESAHVVSITDRVRGALSDILIAQSPEDLGRLADNTELILADLRDSIQAFPQDKIEDLAGLIDDVQQSLLTLNEARRDEFVSQASVAEKVEEALVLANNESRILEEASDAAYFDLVLGGEETIETVDSTLTQLIERDFAVYQSALEIRSEVNLLSGLALSWTQTRDSSIQAIVTDLTTASNGRLSGLLATLSSVEATAELAESVEVARASLIEIFESAGSLTRPNAILSIRQSVDVALSAAIDDLYFELVINSDDAKTSNRESIRLLLDEQVARIREEAALDSSTKSFFASVMQTALSRDNIELGLNAEALALAAAQLNDTMQGSSDEIKANLTKILKIAHPETGIISTRGVAFDAEKRAKEATQSAATSVLKIAGAVSQFASDAQSQIESSAEALNEQVLQARQRIQTIGLISVVLVLMAPGFIWWMVTRPLNRITKVTETLAQGDLSEITGLEGQRGEIGRMAQALKVFRRGALERIQLQKDEKKREEKIQAAELAAEETKRTAEAQAREAEETRLKQERERKAQELAREEEMRLKEDRERKARLDQQELVVTELARGLKRLSDGDLTHVIDASFPQDYEGLREDYNSAIISLSAIVQKIGRSAKTIDGSSTEIADSSLDLSRRTENSAATLEETAAALNELTTRVSSAASGASDTAREIDTVKSNTEKSREVMRNAVHAMGEIEGSSSEIVKIVEVIDSIAFQTNLLALNAGVEAARAGAAGSGFAVVASEVRILAHRCSEAAEQINTLISASTSHVKSGVSLLSDTSLALDTILKDISTIARNVSDIADSADEQSVGVSEINTAVEQLDRTTQQNAAMFEETTAASQSLTDEAKQLTQIVAGFSVPTEKPETNSKRRLEAGNDNTWAAA